MSARFRIDPERVKEELFRRFELVKQQFSKPLTRDNLYFHYLPLGGVVSYSLLSVNVMEPRLSGVVYSSLGLPADMSTSYTVLSVAGLSLHLYNRHTFAGKELYVRGGVSLYHTGLFVLGSILSWAILARSLPNSAVVKTGLALASSISMLKLTQNTLDQLDNKMGSTLGRK